MNESNACSGSLEVVPAGLRKAGSSALVLRDSTPLEQIEAIGGFNSTAEFIHG
jgi:hypothetical protein